MGYQTIKKNGSWRLVYREDNGKAGTHQRTVSPSSREFLDLGLKQEMSREEANKLLDNGRKDCYAQILLRRRARTESRIKLEAAVVSAWLPEDVVSEFEGPVLEGTTKRIDQWRKAKRLIAKAEVPPEEWHIKPAVFWKQFEALALSDDSVRKLTKLINAYGNFYAYKRNGRYLPLPKPNKLARESIRRAYNKKTQTGRVTHALTEEELTKARIALPIKEYNWLAIAYWFGLRKEEADNLMEKPGPKWYLEYDDKRFKFVLHIFQDKLERQGHVAEKCWIAKPAHLPEQIELLQAIEGRQLESPKTDRHSPLKKINPRITARSARKGFTTAMKRRGFSRAAIDLWLGHLGGSTYELHYDERNVAYWEPPVERQKAS